MKNATMSPEAILSEAAFCGDSAAAHVSVNPSLAAQYAASAWRHAVAYLATGSTAHLPKRTVNWAEVRRG